MARLALPKLRRGAEPRLQGARLIVGLGNPGPKYARNRHNTGARVIEELSRELNIPLNRRERLADVGQALTAYGPVALARPKTFMNESGRAVLSLLKIYGAKLHDLILIVDEMDIEPGRLRVRDGGGDAGQRGMRSIRQVIGDLDFPRVRIGVGRPYVHGQPSRDPDVVAEHLLSNSPPEEYALIREAEKRAAQAVIAILRDGVEAAMNAYNGEPAPPVPPAEPPKRGGQVRRPSTGSATAGTADRGRRP